MAPHPQIPGLEDWKPLARGGLAVVWAARDVSSDREVAVKVYQQGLQEADRRHFLREASAAGRVAAHPGIVTTYSSGVLPDDRPYLVMELCPGGSLTRWLKPENRPTEEQVRQVGVRLADTLAAVHAAGLLHRDVKPGNVLIDSSGRPRLADFGLALERGAQPDPGDSRWMTPAWAPPEAFRMEPATEAGDVYSLAATLYALLAGRPPRDLGPDDVPLEQLADVVRTPVWPIPGVSRPLMEVVLAALDDEPAARPSAATFFGQLAKVPLQTPRRGALVRGVLAGSAATARASSVAAEVPASGASDRGSGAPTALETQEAPARTSPAATPPPEEERPPHDKRRTGLLVLVAAALLVVIASTTAWLVRGPSSSGASTPATQSTAASAPPSSATAPGASSPPSPASATPPGSGGAAAPASPQGRSIQVVGSADNPRPYQAAWIKGTYPGGPRTLLRVQRWERGSWLTFPIPTMTDESGEFTAYVELAQPGRYRVRVLDPGSGVKSDPVVLVVKA